MGGLLAGFIWLCKSLFFRCFLDLRVCRTSQFQLDRACVIGPFAGGDGELAQGGHLQALSLIQRLSQLGQCRLDRVTHIFDLDPCRLGHPRDKVARA